MHSRTSAILNFWQSYVHLKIASLYGDCVEPGGIEKSNTNNLATPTDPTKDPYMIVFYFKGVSQKSASVVER